jgi:hypothetical protein
MPTWFSIVEAKSDRQMASYRGFTLGLLQRWNLISAMLLIVHAISLLYHAYDLRSVVDLSLALFLLIVGAGVILRNKIAILLLKIFLGGSIVILLSGMINPFLISEAKHDLAHFYSSTALAIVVCSAVLALIILGERREQLRR